MKRHLLLPAVIATAALFFACVGSDSEPDHAETPGGEAGASSGADGSHVNDGGTSADDDDAEATPSCAGQSFGDLVAISPQGAAFDAYLDLRIVGMHAYFSARIKPAYPPEGTPRYFGVVIGNYHPSPDGGTSSFDDSTSDVSISALSSTHQRSPTASRLEDLLVYAQETTGDTNSPRKLYFATRSGTAYGSAMEIATLNLGDHDQTDPWLIGGQPAKALYFARGSANRTGLTIARSAVTQSGASASFAVDQAVGATCPLGENCEFPVVTADQGTLFYSRASATAEFKPAVFEQALDRQDGTTTHADAIGHPELGQAVPSWVSDDGCDIIVTKPGTLAPSTFARAHRTAK